MPASEPRPGQQWPYQVSEEVEPEPPARPELVRGAKLTIGVLLAFSDAVGGGGPILLGVVVFITGCLGAMMASHARRLGLLATNVVLSMLLLPWFVYHIFRMVGLI